MLRDEVRELCGGPAKCKGQTRESLYRASVRLLVFGDTAAASRGGLMVTVRGQNITHSVINTHHNTFFSLCYLTDIEYLMVDTDKNFITRGCNIIMMMLWPLALWVKMTLGLIKMNK